MAVCENPYYIVFDPNCSYSLQQDKYRPVDKPQVCTRLPLIWPQNSWEEVLPEGDPFDEDDHTTNATAKDSDEVKDGSDSIWPYNSSGFCNSPSTTDRKGPSSDHIFPHNSSHCRIKQETSFSFGGSNTSPVSKDSGNYSCTTSRLDDVCTNEDSSGENKQLKYN